MRARVKPSCQLRAARKRLGFARESDEHYLGYLLRSMRRTVELAQCGAKVTSVGSAEEALKALEKLRFDLLVSDIGLPKMDGYELIRRVRKREAGQEKRIPAVALTAYARIQDRMQAILAGFSTHVAKPIEANELVTVVASLAGRLGKTS